MAESLNPCPDWLEKSMPFRRRFVSTLHGNIHVIDEGPQDGATLVMLHGNPTWSFYYRRAIRAFMGTHRVVAIDHLGCGGSDKPEDAPYRLEDHIDRVLQVLDHLNVKSAALMVHDWGGAIGFGAALQRPELFQRFVVLNTAAFPSERMPFSIGMCRVPGFGAWAVRGLNAFARVALLRCVVKRGRLTEEVKAGYLAPYADWKSRVALHRFVQDIPMRPEHPSWRRLSEVGNRLHELQDRPLLLLWGAQDFCFNETFYTEWCRRFPMAESHFLQDCGHYVLEDGHEHALPLIERFLERTAGSQAKAQSPVAGPDASDADTQPESVRPSQTLPVQEAAEGGPMSAAAFRAAGTDE